MKSPIKTPNGLKTVMTLLGAEEISNKALQAELIASAAEATVQPTVSATLASDFPATQTKVSGILKRK